MERTMLGVKLRDKIKIKKSSHSSKKPKYCAFRKKTKMGLGGTSEQIEGILVGQQSNLLANVGRKKTGETKD